jgi:hypothetical protein
MADKADQALKLAQKVEKDLKTLTDLVRKIEKVQNDWEKEQTNWIQSIDKKLADAINEQNKKFTDAHNQQAKEIDGVVAWAKQTFDTKGWF